MKVTISILADKELIVEECKCVLGVREEMGYIRIYGSTEGRNYVVSYDRNAVLSYELSDIPDNEEWKRTIAVVTKAI